MSGEKQNLIQKVTKHLYFVWIEYVQMYKHIFYLARLSCYAVFFFSFHSSEKKKNNNNNEKKIENRFNLWLYRPFCFGFIWFSNWMRSRRKKKYCGFAFMFYIKVSFPHAHFHFFFFFFFSFFSFNTRKWRGKNCISISK